MPRLLCLDGLRGLLATYVLLGHMAPFADVPPGWHWAQAAVSHGMAAVDVFFILSGLVITQSLAAMQYRPVPFLIARAARIYPVFLAVFAAAIVVQAACPQPFAHMPWVGADSPARDIWARTWPAPWPAHVLAHLTMTHGLFPAAVLPMAWQSFLGAAWSLSTEWQFYALIALVAPWRRDRLFWQAGLFLAAAAAGIAWAAIASPNWEFSRAFLPNKAQYFALGIASAALLRAPGGRAWRGYACVLAMALALSALQGGAAKLVPCLAWTLCLAAQLRPIGVLAPLARLLAGRALLWLGALSYCLYLVNEPVQLLLGVALAAWAGSDAAAFAALWLPGAILLPIGLAWLLHRTIEQPGLRTGKRLARAALARRTRPMPVTQPEAVAFTAAD